MNVTDLSHPAIQKVIGVAARKGVALDIRLLPESARTAEEAAAAVDAEVGQIVKSLVFVVPRPDGRLAPIICLVSGRNEVDLTLLAAVTGEVAIRPATLREARELTGYPDHGTPPFGHGRDVRILMDHDLAQYEWIWAAAGTDTAILRVAPGTLRMLSNAIVAPMAVTSWIHSAALGQLEPRLQFGAGTGS